MRNLITIPVVAICALACTASAANYSTEANMTRQKDKGTYEVVVRVSRLVERNGTVGEELVTRPCILSAPGVPGSIYVGPQDSEYAKKESVSVDVSWPEAGKSDFAVCTVTVKLGEKIVSKTKTKVMVEER
jgi:hypothetical protein